MERKLRQELSLALVLLGADEVLLGAVRAWRDGAEDPETLADLRNWNEAKRAEFEEWLPTMNGAELEAAQARIRHYDEVRALKKAA